MNVEEKSFDAVHDLELRLYRYLRIPIPDLWQGDAAREQPSHGGQCDAIEQLRQAVWELRQDAARIGRIPSGYPRHIDLVMKLISALLPWYTRSLVQFGQRTTHTFEVMANAVEELWQRQDSLMAEPNRRRKVDLWSQGESKSPGEHPLP